MAAKLMRLDKYVAEAMAISRVHAKRLIQSKRIHIDGQVSTNIQAQVNEQQSVTHDHKPIQLIQPLYIALHKPLNYICSTQDEAHPSALNLITGQRLEGAHFAGRLDADTTGLVLVSNDGQWTHRITSPRKSCVKRYRVWLAEPLSEESSQRISEGVILKNETKATKPCVITPVAEKEVLIDLSEGKYHQVRRLFASEGNKVVRLHREGIGPINLEGLEEGDWRALTAEEVAGF